MTSIFVRNCNINTILDQDIFCYFLDILYSLFLKDHRRVNLAIDQLGKANIIKKNREEIYILAKLLQGEKFQTAATAYLCIWEPSILAIEAAVR